MEKFVNKSYMYLVVSFMMLASTSLWASSSDSRSRPTHIQKAEIPSVDGEIIKIKSSPDYTHVGLIIRNFSNKKPTTGSLAPLWTYSAAIFDPANHKILIRTPLMMSGANFQWSPDGKWAAITGDWRKIHLLSVNGTYRNIALDHGTASLIWSQDSKSQLFSELKPQANGNRASEISETNIDTCKPKSIPIPQVITLGLFCVNGKPCMGYLKIEEWRSSNQVLYAMDIISQTQLVRLPLYGAMDYWDKTHFQISPDGKYFLLNAEGSASTRTVVGSVEDANVIFNKPSCALMWQDDIMNQYDVIWPRRPNTKNLYGENLAALLVSDDTTYELNLYTGSRKVMQRRSPARPLDLWKPAKEDYTGLMGQWMVVTEKGLELCNYQGSNGEFNPVSLLLRHKTYKEE